MASVSFKGIPQPLEWANATVDISGNVECPVCYVLVSRDSVEKHTDWHRSIMEILKVLCS